MESNLSNTESPSPSPSSPSPSSHTTPATTNTTNNENLVNQITTSTTTNTTPSSGNIMTTTTTKPKRQRRSYSCGPCKLLKIKCDLQIPCTACKKFNRINRCLLQPPQPPSEQELSKIQERKKRTTIKKMKLSNEFVQAYNVNPNALPSMISTVESTSKNYEKKTQKYKMNQILLDKGSPLKENNHKISNQLSNSNGSRQDTQLSKTQNSIPPHSLIEIQRHHLSFQQPQMNKQQLHPISYITSVSSPSSTLTSTTFNFPQNSQQEDVIQYLLDMDSQKNIDLTMVDIKRIKRLLPNDFALFKNMFDCYLNTINPIAIDMQDFSEIFKQSNLVYNKLLSIDDENPRNLSINVPFTLIELRNLSLFFLILVNGLLFDFRGSNNKTTMDNARHQNHNNHNTNFLLERRLYKSKNDMIEDWIKISKFIKLKVLAYESLTDIIFLIDWYMILKNYYDYENMVVENYLEFNNLLNYLVLNNDFINTIEDPYNEVGRNPNDDDDVDDDKDTTTVLSSVEEKQVVYPDTRHFKVLSKYWIQLRLIEIDYTFFQFKGSLLFANQLKGTVVPHKKILSTLYKDIELDPITTHLMKIWGLYYKRSKNTTSVREIIKDYLLLYCNMMGTLKDELNEFETTKPLESPNLRSINLKDIELLIKNQRLLHLFVRWLSFIRIESNYFPSLRYTTYLTTIMNLFNHFNYLDDRSNSNVLSMIFNNYSLNNIKLFYQCLVFQGIFLVLLKNALNGNNIYPNSIPKFKINLEKIYQFLLHQYQTTLNKILNHEICRELLENITLFKLITNLSIEFNQYLINPITNNNNNNNLNSKEKDLDLDLTDLIYDLKSKISSSNWDLLLNYFFGSKDNFARYIEKIWDLFQYLKIDPTTTTVSTPTTNIPITSKIYLNDHLIDEVIGKFSGFKFDEDVVNNYFKHCVEPNIFE